MTVDRRPLSVFAAYERRRGALLAALAAERMTFFG